MGSAINAWREQLEQEEDAQIVSKPSKKRNAPDDVSQCTLEPCRRSMLTVALKGEPAFDETEIRSKHASGLLKKVSDKFQRYTISSD